MLSRLHIQYNIYCSSIINNTVVSLCTKASSTFTFKEYLQFLNMFPKIFTTKSNDSSILITIISWDYLNLQLANTYVGDVTIPTQVIKYNQCFSRRIDQSACSIYIKLNYLKISKIMDGMYKITLVRKPLQILYKQS